MIGTIVASIGLVVWVWMLVARDGFWLARERDDMPFPAPPVWPPVTAIVPARDEAEVIGRAIEALVAQDYPSRFSIILVDDGSSDGTAAIARRAATDQPVCTEPVEVLPFSLPATRKDGASTGSAQTDYGARLGSPTEDAEVSDRLRIIAGTPPPRGWTGKLWAMRNGMAAADPAAPLLWFTDADIVHAPDTLRMLVARMVAEKLVLHSLMAKLRCESVAERALVPAFVFFFQMLYPFAAVNRPARATAAAAGGCMLVDRAALERAGGLATIAAALIDDCAMGRALKTQGPVRLSLTDRAVSIRPYGGWGEIGAMVSRSAYAQLGYSPWLLGGTLAGMVFVYLAPPLLALFGHGAARWLGLAAWALMALAFQPMLRFYRRSPLWGAALPAIGAFYAWATFASALAHWRGRGGMWKGRAQAQLAP